ncbi:MAG TPA: sugar transferase [Desulfotomaculum sp.]|nr:MAG: Undecaprenyl-phosphate galactosephosphotransferase [Desulfotomaculum sp. 46_80]HAG10971.1 sugar transferase [Desulfotomaculum sp.]
MRKSRIDSSYNYKYDIITKRIIDILLSISGLMLLGWVILLSFLISTIDTRSNGFFTQDRVGKNTKLFKIIKIKTMRNESNNKSTVTVKSDPRITKAGYIFRKFKIDELPQLINVLNGTMSLVGPRPTVVEDMQKMNEMQRNRFKVKPGLTGLAQINGNTELTWPQRIEYDLEYIEKQSLWFDLLIIFRTFQILFKGNIETHPRGKDEWLEI